MIKLSNFEEVNNNHNPFWLLPFFFFILSSLPCSSQKNQCGIPDTSACYVNEKFISSPLQIEKKWETKDTTWSHNTPLICDIDGDCIPEIITAGIDATSVLIIDSKSGKLKSKIKTELFEWSLMPSVICDVDNDGKMELILHIVDRPSNPQHLIDRLVCYELDGTIKWVSNTKLDLFKDICFTVRYSGFINITDFNQDGKSEIYISNQIFDGLTGIKLADGGINGLGRDSTYAPISIAGQLDSDTTDLELAAGYTIYKVKISNSLGMIGNSMTPSNIEVNNRYLDGSTSIADIDLDGILDVTVSSPGFGSNAVLYAYTLIGNTPKLIAKTNPTNPEFSMGAPVIGKIHSNRPSILITRPFELICYTFDGTQNFKQDWIFTTSDRSGSTLATIFDLNADGSQEIIYRDETYLHILNVISNIPQSIYKLNCTSPTKGELPVVADIDNSGEAKICVTCDSDSSKGYEHIKVFGPPDGQKWAPARSVWNQYAYNPLQINDDLTVPRVQKNQATYMNGKYNNFMQQESLLDENGYFKKPAASLTGKINSIDLDPKTNEYILKFEIYNRADASLTADSAMPVSFYNGDPSAGGTLIGVYHTLKKIVAGDSLLNLEYRFFAANLSRVFMVVNTLRNTTGAFEPKDFSILECDYSDNTFQTTAPPIIRNPDPCNPHFCFIKEKFISTSLKLEKKLESEQNTQHISMPLLADVDGDCIPDLIINSLKSDSVLIIDSRSGKTKGGFKKHISYNDLSDLLVIDVDQNSSPEIITYTESYSSDTSFYAYRLICYKLDGTVLWYSDKKLNLHPNYPTADNEKIGAADFNQDGIPEIYISNKIFNAKTGVQLTDGGQNGLGINIQKVSFKSVSVAADLDNDSTDLELAAGYTIYKVKINNINGLTGNSMTPYNIQINGKFEDGITSVADIDQNGILDVIVSVSGYNSDPIFYAYYLNNGIPKLIASAYPPAIPTQGFAYTRSITLPCIGKIDSIHPATLIVGVSTKMYAYYYDGSINLRLKWALTNTDSGGTAGITLFDLNGDGLNEIIYRDETHINIIDGSSNTPRVVHQLTCLSGTYNEFPIIGDIDNSGESKICVTCALGNNYDRDAKLTVFGPPNGQRWAPARRIWNQYAYNPLFINDDLTVPRVQKNQATYMNGKYNNFIQQESLLDENRYYKKPAASLTGLIYCVEYDPLTNSFTVRFELHNRNDASRVADVGLPVSFYGANPELDTALLGVYHTREIIRPGDSLRDLSFKFSASDLTRIYLVVNTRRNTTGPFDSTHFDQLECDYTDNFYYIIDLPKIQRDSVSICEGSEYMFYDTTIYDAGKYHRSLKNQKGCDSLIVLLDLALSNIVRTQNALSSCEVYDWNGKMITQTGIYFDTLLTIGGCDSISTLDLLIHPSVSQTQTISACDRYNWNGQTYIQSGQYVFNGQTENGCDSTVTLDLTIHPSAIIEEAHSTCESYLWNGQNYSTSGRYTFQSQTQNGCDSMVILNLIIDSVIRQQISHTTCDRYAWNGQTLTQSGTYTHQDISQSGCDSIVTLELTVLSSSNSRHRIATCDSYLWNGNNYTQSGTYQFSTMNADGCDSIATLELTILSSSSSMSQISNCEAYFWNGQNYTQSGIYEFKTQNSAGCDSTATLELTILPIHQNNIQESACNKYIWNGITYDQSGNYTFNTKNQFGCDSSITLELEILKSSSATISLSTCDSLVFQGQTLSKSGTYPFTIRNAVGCDSVIILNLSINSDQQISSVSSCDPYRWDVDGQNYAQSGRYLKTFTNAQGCDSVHVLDFKRLPSHLINEKAEVCGPFFWPVTNTLLDQSGLYSHPLQTTEGCDSLLNLELIIHPHFIKTDTVISQTDYIWRVNNTNYSASGNYEEQYSSEFGCDSIHRLILIIKNEQGIYYPNVLIPGGISGGFTIFDNLYTIASITTLSIYDRWGSLVWQKHNFAPNDPTLGWDGRFKNQHVVPGVYTWHAQLTLKDGTYQTIKGDLTILR